MIMKERLRLKALGASLQLGTKSLHLHIKQRIALLTGVRNPLN
jgi:hypothetical protein